MWFSLIRVLQRYVLYLGWPISLVYEPKCGGRGELRGLSQWVPYNCTHGAQINFGDLTPYLTYVSYCLQWRLELNKWIWKQLPGKENYKMKNCIISLTEFILAAVFFISCSTDTKPRQCIFRIVFILWICPFKKIYFRRDDSSPVVFSQTVQLGGRLYLAEWIIWPPAQFFNFYFLPTR